MDEPHFLENMILNEQVSLVVEIMNKTLKKKHLKIMYLHYFAELDVKEIAQQLNIPTKTIYSAINLSIQKIRKELRLSNET